MTMFLCLSAATAWGESNVAAKIGLEDQFGRTNSISFPRENPCVLMIADRDGERQLDGWTGQIAEKSGERVDIYGLAALTHAPRAIRALIRDSFRKNQARTVLLDWDGKVAADYAYAGKQALVLVIDRKGLIRHRATGAADAAKLEAILHSLAETDP
ncbi:MAG: hypothetical protein ABSD58_16915 [Verrucomicrobiia bacterium]